MSVSIKRIYDEIGDDGFRILVDRLWPRGIKKESAGLDSWLKDVAPSPELRKWFGHDPEKFHEFSVRYRRELASNPAVRELKQIISENKKTTLLYAAKDAKVNHAAVLRDFISQD